MLVYRLKAGITRQIMVHMDIKKDYKGVRMFERDINILRKVFDTNYFTQGDKEYIELTFMELAKRESKE